MCYSLLVVVFALIPFVERYIPFVERYWEALTYAERNWEFRTIL